jgi:TonB family protein
MSIRGCVLALSVFVMVASATVAARADECQVRVLSMSLEGKGTSDQIYRYRVVLEATSSDAPQDVDLQIQTTDNAAPLTARAPHLQFFQDENAYDDVVVFDRPSQDVSSIAVADTGSGDAVNPCTSTPVHLGDPVVGLVGWDIPTVIAAFSDAGRKVPDASKFNVITGRSKSARFKFKAPLNYPQIAKDTDVSGRVIVTVQLGTEGQLVSSRVAESSRFALLDAAALEAARSSTFTAHTLDGIPVVSWYKIIYKFILDGEDSGPPEISDLLKYYCPAIIGSAYINATLYSGKAFWYGLDLTTADTQFDSIQLAMADTPSHANEFFWNTILSGSGGTINAGHDASIDYSSMSGALFWPGAALTSGTVQAITQHTQKSATCKPYPSNVSNELDSNSLVAVAQTDRPWLTTPVVETVLPARFATMSWPIYAPAIEPPQPLAIQVSVHVTQSGFPLIGVVHNVSDAPAFATAALNAAMASTYVVPFAADGAVITQTFDILYLYVPPSAPAGNPVGLVSLDRSDGNRRRPPHD